MVGYLEVAALGFCLLRSSPLDVVSRILPCMSTVIAKYKLLRALHIDLDRAESTIFTLIVSHFRMATANLCHQLTM